MKQQERLGASVIRQLAHQPIISVPRAPTRWQKPDGFPATLIPFHAFLLGVAPTQASSALGNTDLPSPRGLSKSSQYLH